MSLVGFCPEQLVGKSEEPEQKTSFNNTSSRINPVASASPNPKSSISANNLPGNHALFASQHSQEEIKPKKELIKDIHPAQISVNASGHQPKELQGQIRKSPMNANNGQAAAFSFLSKHIKENQGGNPNQPPNSGYYFGQVHSNQGNQTTKTQGSSHSGNSGNNSSNTSSGIGHNAIGNKETVGNSANAQSSQASGPLGQKKPPGLISGMVNTKQENVGGIESKSPKGLQQNLLASNLLSRINSNNKQIDPKKQMMLEQFNAAKGNSKLLPFAPKNTGLGTSKGTGINKNDGQATGYFSKHAYKN